MVFLTVALVQKYTHNKKGQKSWLAKVRPVSSVVTCVTLGGEVSCSFLLPLSIVHLPIKTGSLGLSGVSADKSIILSCIVPGFGTYHPNGSLSVNPVQGHATPSSGSCWHQEQTRWIWRYLYIRIKWYFKISFLFYLKYHYIIYVFLSFPPSHIHGLFFFDYCCYTYITI